MSIFECPLHALLTGDGDRLLGVPLSGEVGQPAVEVTAVVQRDVGKEQLRHAGVDDHHLGWSAVALIVVSEADRRTVVGARVGRQDATDQYQRITDLDSRVVRQ